MAEKTTSTQPLGTMTEPRPATYIHPGYDDYVPAPTPSPSFADRLRTPVAGAILGGVVILGVGFGAGYLVGNDSGSSSSVVGPGGQTGQPGSGQTGQGFGQGFGPGQTGGAMGGFGSQPGTGQPGTGQPGTGQQGTGQTQDGTGTTQVPGTATQSGDGTTTSFVA